MNQTKPVWQGVVLVAGGAIGAGMFALPFISAGPWTFWSFIGLLIVWLATYFSATLLLNTTLSVLHGSRQVALSSSLSFDTLISEVLGKRWATANNISITFIMMILMYAYISAGAGIIEYTFEKLSARSDLLSRQFLSISFSLLVAFLIWVGTTWVAKISVVLMAIMAASFFFVALSIWPHIAPSLLIEPSFSLAAFVMSALPVYVAAFACAGLVPSLVRHFDADKRKVKHSLFWGTFLALIVYCVWLTLTFGVVPRLEFIELLNSGGETSDLVYAIGQNTGESSDSIQARLTWFSHCAIITSFLSVALGLFHFIQDKFSLDNSSLQRFYAVVICFFLPSIGSFLYPKGFVLAIGYAGLFVAFSFFVVPALMALKQSENVVSHGTNADSKLAYMVLGFGILIGVLKILLTMGYLPVPT